MPLPSDPLGLAIKVYNILEEASDLGGRSCKGAIPEDQDYDDYISSLNRCGLLTYKKPADRIVEFDYPQGFFLTISHLLKGSRHEERPEEFYVANIDFRYSDQSRNVPNILKNYVAATELFQMFKVICDLPVKVGSSHQLVFSGDNRLKISSKYCEEDLIALPDLNEFEANFITSTMHTVQKKIIIKTALMDMYKGKQEISFSSVIRRFSDLVGLVSHSYELYVSEFSFKKVKTEIEQDKLKYIAQINKVFSDIQNQILTMPAAVFLVGSQMKPSSSWAGANIVIWLASVIFTVFLLFLIRNQRHTLLAIKFEIDQQWNGIEDKYHLAFNRFKGVYAQLNRRFDHQKLLLTTVEMLTYTALAVSTALLLYFQGESQSAMALLMISIPILTVIFTSFVFGLFIRSTSKKSKGSEP